jgi:hypothetical protein
MDPTVDEAAVVESPANALVTAYVPAVVGAVTFALATPEAFVVALVFRPLKVNLTVLPATGVPPAVVSEAESVTVAPRAADVGPVYVTTVPSFTASVEEAVSGAPAASPAKLTPIGYEPAVAGALTVEAATPELSVTALVDEPFRVNVTVRPARRTPELVLSVADSVTGDPVPADFAPV